MLKRVFFSTLCAVSACAGTQSMVQSADWYVAPQADGVEAGDGSQERPFRSLVEARDAVRAYRAENGSGESIQVWLLDGTYYLDETFHLDVEDSGSEESPVIWSAAPGARPCLIGGQPLVRRNEALPQEITKRLNKSAREHVVVYAMPGVPAEQATRLTVVEAERHLHCAQHPNEGWAMGTQGLGEWRKKLPAEFEVQGFFANSWDDERVTGSLKKHQLTLTNNGQAVQLNETARYRILGTPECIDAPGEWCYEPTTQSILVWPTTTDQPLVCATVEVLVAIYDAAHVKWQGIDCVGAREQAIEVAHCDNVCIEGCTIKAIGHTGVHLFGGKQCSVVESTIHDCGQTGVRIEAGDRSQLTAAEHLVRDCHIQHIGCTTITDSAAVHVVGVGNVVSSNEISDCADAAIHVDGNDHLIDANVISRACRDTADCGAIYLGHDWTERGTTISRNVIRDTGLVDRLNSIAIYLDDFASGAYVHDNVISNAGRGIVIGGGECNRVENNLIEDCVAGIQIDDRGNTWLSSVVENRDEYLHAAWNQIKDAHALYFAHYPEMTDLETGIAAHRNQIVKNVLQRCGAIAVDDTRVVERNEIAANQIGNKLFTIHWGADPQLSFAVGNGLNPAEFDMHPAMLVAVEPTSPSDRVPVQVVRRADRTREQLVSKP